MSDEWAAVLGQPPPEHGGPPGREEERPVMLESDVREPFPLARLAALPAWCDVGGPRHSRRILRDVNEAIESLNWLSGCRRRVRRAGPCAERQLVHDEILERVVAAVLSRPRPASAPLPEEALKELLRGRGLYPGTETAFANLAAFREEAVSLPNSVLTAPYLDELLPPDALAYLEGFEERMLISQEGMASRAEEESVRVHSDRTLMGSRRRYGRFVRQLCARGLVDFTLSPVEVVGVFFV